MKILRLLRSLFAKKDRVDEIPEAEKERLDKLPEEFWSAMERRVNRLSALGALYVPPPRSRLKKHRSLRVRLAASLRPGRGCPCICSCRRMRSQAKQEAALIALMNAPITARGVAYRAAKDQARLNDATRQADAVWRQPNGGGL